MLVETNGSRLWRQAYRFDGKQKLIALGAYPTVSLAEPRNARDANKALLAKGVDPSAQRKLDRTAARLARTNTFRIIADELVAKFEVEGDDPKTLKKKKWLVDLLCAEIGDRPIAEIAAPELLDALKKIERRGRYESARRARSLSGRIFRYAIVTGRAARDPSADLAGALIAPKVQHRASITEPKAVGALLRAIDDIDGQATTRAALQLIALTFVRPGELRHAEWTEFDTDNAIWDIPAQKMKMPRPHKVPLSRQALALIAALREVTGSSRFLFPQIRSWHRPFQTTP
ncbi:integrase [Bradyrhizobium sp. USDA 3311]|uniref:tyrosine-type recombinase/integrase n=1 Tax=Bradyrhizobium sp. LCT2 TaxID=2493093 RepID=UPI00352DC8C5